jgi:hypothetical protein
VQINERRKVMKRFMVWILLFVAMFSLNLIATAKEKDRTGNDSACTAAMVAGTWVYSETGTVYISGVATPYASLGTYVLDSLGNISGSRTAFLSGDPTPRKATIKGTATVNADCTGSETLYFYDGSGTLIGYGAKTLIFLNNGREVRKLIVPDMTIPGMVPAVLLTEGKKMFPDDIYFESR